MVFHSKHRAFDEVLKNFYGFTKGFLGSKSFYQHETVTVVRFVKTPLDQEQNITILSNITTYLRSAELLTDFKPGLARTKFGKNCLYLP